MFRSLTKEQKRTLNVISFVEFSRMLGIFLVIPVIAIFAEKFTSSGYLIGIAVASYEISMAIFQIPMGKLSDKIGRRNAIIIGLIPYIIGNILSFYGNTITILIVSRFIAGSGAISSPAIAWAQETVETEKKSLSMSYVGASIGLAFLMGTSFSPEISSLLGIRSVFLISAVVGLISLFTALIPLIYNVNLTTSTVELKRPAMGARVFVIALISFLVSTSAFIFFYLLQIYSVQSYGLSGYSFILFLPVIVGGGIAVIFTEKFRNKGSTMPKEISFSIMGTGLAVLSLIAFFDLSPWEISLLLIPFFTGYSFYELLMIPFLSRIIRNKDYGLGMGIFYSFQFLGSATGALIGGEIIGSHSNSSIIQISIAVCLLTVVISFLLSTRFTSHSLH